MPNGIAWDYLEPIQRAQLLHCRPDLIKREQCKRCGGYLFVESDQYDTYLSCLQCGSSHDLEGELEIRDPIAEGIIVRGTNAGYRGGGHRK